jgi:hypothetical protein
MSKLSRSVLTALGVAVLALAAMPANATCSGGSPQVATPYIFTNPDFYAACGVSFGWYASGCTPAQPGTPGGPGSVSHNAQFFFWGAGDGNPGMIGGGTTATNSDSGTHPVIERRSLVPGGVDGPFDNGWYYYSVQVTSEWGDSRVDGCDTEGGSGCTCFLAVDEINNVGTMALHSILPDVLGNYNLPNPTVAAAIPAPVINSSTRAGQNVNLQVTMPNFTLGNPQAFSQAGGACGPCATITYLLYQARGARPGTEGGPTTRDLSDPNAGPGLTMWTLIPGQPVGGTALGSPVAVTVDGGTVGNQVNIWIAAQILADSGFQTFVAGSDSTRVEAGPNLNDGDINDPQLQPRPRPRPDATPQKPGRRTSSSR